MTEEGRGKREGHTDQQVDYPKNTSVPSFSFDYTVPSRNSIISDPTSNDPSRRKRMLDYAFLGDCNRRKVR